MRKPEWLVLVALFLRVSGVLRYRILHPKPLLELVRPLHFWGFKHLGFGFGI